MVDKVDRSNKYEPNNVEEVEKVIKDGGRWELRCARGRHKESSSGKYSFTGIHVMHHFSMAVYARASSVGARS